MSEEVSVTEAFVYRGKDGDFRWYSRSANHEIIASGEGYRDKDDAYAACKASIPEGIQIRELE